MREPWDMVMYAGAYQEEAHAYDLITHLEFLAGALPQTCLVGPADGNHLIWGCDSPAFNGPFDDVTPAGRRAGQGSPPQSCSSSAT